MMKRLAPTTRRVVALSLLVIVLLAGLTPGHAAAQPPVAEPVEATVEAPPPARPWFSEVSCQRQQSWVRNGIPVTDWLCYGRVNDEDGPVYEPIILFSSATLDVWPESTTGLDGGSFYQRFTFPQSVRGFLTMTGYSPETGLFTQDAYSRIN